MNRIVSALPGRIRVRDPALRTRQTNERLRTITANFDGIRSVEGNSKAGSLLLLYDAMKINRSSMEAQVEAALAAELDSQDQPVFRSSPTPAAPRSRIAAGAVSTRGERELPPRRAPEAAVPGDRRGPPFSRRALARRLNGYAKVGMVASLGASLALAAAGNKRLHIATGGVYLALLGIHMAVHRRHLLK